MIGWTFCSGIGAPEVAGSWVDWRLASEIEKFPRSVLKARFGYKSPKNHNQGEPLLWGDMTEVNASLAHSRGVPLPEIIVAGTPCQAFSVAGLRKGTEDPRGNLTLAFVEIVHDLVAARHDGKLAVLWENVPGVLSDKGNAFGAFLGGLVGALDALPQPAGGCWPGEGMVEGPRARAAWAVLDAQWFGVAQRRRRVFVVVDFGNCVDPAAVLLEPDRLRGNSPSRRETRQEIAGGAGTGFEVAGTLDSRVNGGGFPGSDGAMGGHVVPTCYHEASSQRASGVASVGYANAGHFGTMKEVDAGVPLRAKGGDTGYGSETLVCASGNAAIPILKPGARTGVSTTDLRAGLGIGADGDPMFTLQAGKQHGVAFAQNTRDEVRLIGGDGSLVGALAAQPGMKQTSYVAVSTSGDIAHTLNTANNGKGCSEDGTGRGVPTIAFSSKDYGADATEDMAPTLRAGGHAESHANAGVPPAVTVALRGREGGATAEVGGEIATALRASTGGGDKPHVLAFQERGRADGRALETNGDLAYALTAPSGGGRAQERNVLAPDMAVRRLTPTECERLQGFPDGHTDVPYRKKPAADGPRYKALGNSMAVPVVRYILDRMRLSMEGAA